MESQRIFSTGVSLCSRIPLSIRALSGAAAHPWSCLPQHGGVRGCVHQTCHHGPRQLPMPGFPTAHQKQVRAVLSLRRLLWICSRAGYRRRGTGVGTVPHGLGGEPGLRREGRVRNTTARGRPLSAPRSSAFPPEVFCPQGHPLSLWWPWEGLRYQCRVEMKRDQKHPHWCTKPRGKIVLTQPSPRAGQ